MLIPRLLRIVLKVFFALLSVTSVLYLPIAQPLNFWYEKVSMFMILKSVLAVFLHLYHDIVNDSAFRSRIFIDCLQYDNTILTSYIYIYMYIY